MSALLAALSLLFGICIAVFVTGGAAAVVFCAVIAIAASVALQKINVEKTLLIQLFVGGLLARVLVGTAIYHLHLQEFFGGDALTYDALGYLVLKAWTAKISYGNEVTELLGNGTGWGMVYLVVGIYSVLGRNMLAVQFFNAVLGAATAPIIYLCARHIFQNSRVARIAAFFVAFYPSLVLWSSQGLKDGPIVFLLALVMLATLKLGERFDARFFISLVGSMMVLFSLRFYIFFMVAAAVGGAFVVGMRPLN
ncbi:MAG TPA: glycosyltransferase family 39 protein, partial [Pyrinomonadaceae bacterium]|nr:glycosyltransferase family 39 protein [Pyrinomonadaceae bacterium]